MKKKSSFTTILLVFLFLAGLSLLLYPSLANYWNAKHQSRAIHTYVEEVANLDTERYAELWRSAADYNDGISFRPNLYQLSEDERAEYESLLNIGGDGVMGYIEIPAIEVTLPIYHGTEDSVLQVAAGHLDWSSLPVGGEGTHCVLSGHRGLPRARLFTDLDRLTKGDIFMLRVLDEVLTYEVDQILIVEPQETQALEIVPGADYCSLVTCTPYGINTHRILIRGHRIETEDVLPPIKITADAVQVEPLLVAPMLAIPLLVLAVVLLYLPVPGRNRRKKGESK